MKKLSMKKWIVYRETYSTIEIDAPTEEEATNIMADLDGDDDGWEYYKEEVFLEPDVSYDEYSMTHTVDRDNDVNEGKSLTVSTWISSLNDMDRILLNRIEALEKENKDKPLTVSTPKLISWHTKLQEMDRRLLDRIQALEDRAEDRILLDRVEALENDTRPVIRHSAIIKNILNRIGQLELLTQKLIDIQVTEDVDRHDDLIDELWVYKK